MDPASSWLKPIESAAPFFRAQPPTKTTLATPQWTNQASRRLRRRLRLGPRLIYVPLGLGDLHDAIEAANGLGPNAKLCWFPKDPWFQNREATPCLGFVQLFLVGGRLVFHLTLFQEDP